MKIYTREQMIEAFNYGKTLEPFDCIEDMLDSLTPIELPSDEEIETYANFAFPYTEEKRGDSYVAYRGMKIGAKWVIEQIKQQDNVK